VGFGRKDESGNCDESEEQLFHRRERFFNASD
jgi:hypothetical protein